MPPRKGSKTIRQVAAELGVGETTAQRYLEQGMPNDGPRRAAWVAAHVPSRASQDQERRDLDSAEKAARILLLQTKQKAADLDFRRREGQLVERSAVVRAWRLHIADAVSQLETLPALLTQLVPEEFRADVQAQCRVVVENVCRGLADGHKAGGDG